MRKCLRCGSEMVEGGTIKLLRSLNPIIISQDRTKMFKGNLGSPNVAICPKCGEVSIYVNNPEVVEI